MINAYASIEHIPAAAWNQVALPGAPDHEHAYLTFRERMEPGTPVAYTYTRAGDVVAAVHAVRTTPATGLFSHPWKLLRSERYLRTDDDGVHARHREFVDAIDWHETLTVRGFDQSLIPGDDEAAAHLVRTLQARHPSVVFPFVDPADAGLRAVLASAGFVRGTVTASCHYDLSGYGNYADFVAAFPRRVRRHHVREPSRLAEAGLSMRAVPLEEHLDDIASLEAANLARYGGTPDPTRLRRVRRMLHDLVGGVRVPAVFHDDRMIACGVQLLLGSSYQALSYGCDYTVQDRSTAYQCIVFHDPIRFCIENRHRTYRLGFEAVEAKYQRGASVQRREMWAWTENTRQTATLGELLDLFDEQNNHYLAKFHRQQRPG